MDLDAAALILFALILVTSGCINGGSGETESEGDQALEVVNLDVQPSEIYAGSRTTVNLHIRNSGELPANLTINSDFEENTEEISEKDKEDCSESIGGPGISSSAGQNEYNKCLTEKEDSSSSAEEDSGGPYGDRILTNRCRDIFDITNFEVRGPGDIRDSSRYYLPERAEVRFTWVLENINTENVPLNGYDCNLKFQVPFDYSVTAYRQLQFKENREIEGTPNLESRSSAGPMAFRIETIGSTSQKPSTFLEGDQAEIAIYMENQGEEGTSYTGFIEADFPDIEASGFELKEQNCGKTKDKITMYNDESERIRCTIDSSIFDSIDGSSRGEISVSTDYTYVQNIGQKSVEVEYRGN